MTQEVDEHIISAYSLRILSARTSLWNQLRLNCWILIAFFSKKAEAFGLHVVFTQDKFATVTRNF